MTNNKRRTSLKTAIYQSYFGIAAIGVVIVIAAFLSTAKLRDNSSHLANYNTPLMVELLKTKSGLNKATSSLRGWMSLLEPSMREENENAWDKEILPALNAIENLVTSSAEFKQKNSIATIREKLADLRELQWYILEAAKSEGNVPARMNFEQFLKPVYEEARSLLIRLSEDMSSSRQSRKQLKLEATNIKMLDLLSRSQLAIAEFIITGNQLAIQSVENNNRQYKSYLERVISAQIDEENETLLIKRLVNLADAYVKLSDRIVKLRNSKDWNIANSMLRDQASLLSRDIQFELDYLLDLQSIRLNDEANAVVSIGENAFWIFVLLLGVMIVSAILLAGYWAGKLMRPISALVHATEEFSAGNLNSPIEINSRDELGQLSRSFDDMRVSLNEREKQLQGRETELKTIIDSVPDAIIVFNQEGVIRTFNPAAQLMFFANSQVSNNQDIYSLVAESYIDELKTDINNIQEEKLAKAIKIGKEMTGICFDKSPIPILLSVNEMQVDGQILLVGVIRDITEQKKVDRMKSEFISVVSHELRTPLTSIRGSLGLLIGGAAGELNEKFSSMLSIAVRNTDRLIRLINEMLDVEKIESGKVILKKVELNIKQLIESTISENDGMASSYNVTLMLGEVDENATVLADRDKLQQVLNNLLSNAIKYSPKGDKVTVSVTQAEQVVTVAVSDNGSGIPADFHSSIFKKFSQADSSATRKKGGTGLGLNIAKAIIEKHQGEIGFTTDEKGTSFYFKLASSKRVNYPKEMSSAESHLSGRILICEDDVDIANLIAQKLGTIGCACEITHSAEEALSLISRNTYSVLLLDLALPGMSGMTLINALKARADTKNLPIIVVSAAAVDVQNSSDGKELDVAAWVQKPFDDTALTNALDRLLHSSSNQMAKVLYVEDDESLAKIFVEMLKNTALVQIENSVEGAKVLIYSTDFDLIVLDLQLIDGSGLELIPIINQLPKPIPILVFSADDLPPEYEKSVTASFVKAASSHEQFIGAIKLQLQLKASK